MTIYTVGHSRHEPDQFVSLVRTHGIVRIADVRSHPVSRWAPQFGKAALAAMLERAGIDYVFLGRELGGRPDGAEYYRDDDTLDVARRAGAADFLAGIARITALGRDQRTAMLCAEEDPAHCHRRRLVAPVLQRAGVRVVHIRGDGRLEPDGGQLDLFR